MACSPLNVSSIKDLFGKIGVSIDDSIRCLGSDLLLEVTGHLGSDRTVCCINLLEQHVGLLIQLPTSIDVGRLEISAITIKHLIWGQGKIIESFLHHHITLSLKGRLKACLLQVVVLQLQLVGRQAIGRILQQVWQVISEQLLNIV